MSALTLQIGERDPVKITAAINQLAQGRSNAIGSVTLAHDGVATSTTVLAPACGASSAVFLFAQTAHAAAVIATTYVRQADVSAGQFKVTHATTTNSDLTFWYVCLG